MVRLKTLRMIPTDDSFFRATLSNPTKLTADFKMPRTIVVKLLNHNFLISAIHNHRPMFVWERWAWCLYPLISPLTGRSSKRQTTTTKTNGHQSSVEQCILHKTMLWRTVLISYTARPSIFINATSFGYYHRAGVTAQVVRPHVEHKQKTQEQLSRQRIQAL